MQALFRLPGQDSPGSFSVGSSYEVHHLLLNAFSSEESQFEQGEIFEDLQVYKLKRQTPELTRTKETIPAVTF